MCTLIILRRPNHDWPVLIAANRDEMSDRPWEPPARHWEDRDHVVAGLDVLAGGTWLGMNDDRVVAAILNRRGSLGPQAGKRSRGELPLEALDHAEASVAADALADLDPGAYRSFNLIVADARDAFWVANDGDGKPIRVEEIEDGLSMVTAHDLNDTSSLRIQRYLPRFRGVDAPDVEADQWAAWMSLMGSEGYSSPGGPKDAMAIKTDFGFETVSSSLIALPSMAKPTVQPVWKFAAGAPGSAPFEDVFG